VQPIKLNRTTLGRYDIQEESDLQVAVFKIKSNTQLCTSFGTSDVALIATVASELGRNILKYGGSRGSLLVSWIEHPRGGGSGVEIQAVDHGPGFTDVSAALNDGYSTGGTLGLGLPGSARIMDSLEIEPGRGAAVTARRWVKKRVRSRPRISTSLQMAGCGSSRFTAGLTGKDLPAPLALAVADPRS
jgi:serine/threonine-protein kinase RsbT